MVHTFVHIFYWRMIALTLNRRAYTDKRVHLNHSVFLRTQYKKLPILTWFAHFPEITLMPGLQWRLKSDRSLSAVPKKHLSQEPTLHTTAISLFRLFLSFDLPCIYRKSSLISGPSSEYDPHDVVCCIVEQPCSTDIESHCRVDTPKDRSIEVAGKVLNDRMRLVVFAIAFSVLHCLTEEKHVPENRSVINIQDRNRPRMRNRTVAEHAFAGIQTCQPGFSPLQCARHCMAEFR